MNDFAKFLEKMLKDVDQEIERASKYNKETLLILQGKCPICGVKREDDDRDPRCPKCRI